MTKRQLLLKAAKLWDKPNVSFRGYCSVDLAGFNSTGLCSTFHYLAGAGNEDVSWEIIRLLPPHTAYVWPPNVEGARARAAWCRKMADEFTKKKKVKK
jgi:hypothetical protein